MQTLSLEHNKSLLISRIDHVRFLTQNPLAVAKSMATGTEDTFAHLTRLSQKPGVRGTLIISRQTGAIVRASGLISRDDSANPDAALPGSSDGVDKENEGAQSAEDVARIVWNFAKVAGDMLEELNGPADDDMKLLRIRSKKRELVIVPGKELSHFRPCAFC